MNVDQSTFVLLFSYNYFSLWLRLQRKMAQRHDIRAINLETVEWMCKVQVVDKCKARESKEKVVNIQIRSFRINIYLHISINNQTIYFVICVFKYLTYSSKIQFSVLIAYICDKYVFNIYVSIAQRKRETSNEKLILDGALGGLSSIDQLVVEKSQLVLKSPQIY